MAVARSGQQLVGFMYDQVINAIDWNRVIVEAIGLHLKNHSNEESQLCGLCIKEVLLRME